MNIVFTIAQNRSLAHAHILGKSLKKTNPSIKFIIGLVDVLPTSYVSEFQIINVSELNIEALNEMAQRYSCDEILGAIKPFFVTYLLKKYNKIFYFEAKSEIVSSLDLYFDILDSKNMVLVPQLNHAHQIEDEKLVLNTGMFSSACFGLKSSIETDKILQWWLSKMPSKAGFNACEGIYSDQLWMNHMPVFFKDIYIDKSSKLNVGFWANGKLNETIHQNYSKQKKYNSEYQKAIKSTSFDTTIIPAYGYYEAPISTFRIVLANLFKKIADIIDFSIKKFGEKLYD